MANELKGLRVAALVAEGFEQIELTGPREALLAAGATVTLISAERGQVQAFNHHDRADTFPIDLALDAAKPEQFDALLLPGGALSPDSYGPCRRPSPS